jgi:hypothetical protein
VFFLAAVHGPGYIARSYFVAGTSANVLVSPLIFTDGLCRFFDSLGGVDLVFVTHADEINPMALCEVGRENPGRPPHTIPACRFRDRFNCPIAAHKADAERFPACTVDLRFGEQHQYSEGIRFLHTPGHTPGSACMIFQHRKQRLAFVGDTVELDAHGQIAADFEDAGKTDVPELLASWKKLLAAGFDVLFPLHSLADSPVQHIKRDAMDALRGAVDRVDTT